MRMTWLSEARVAARQGAGRQARLTLLLPHNSYRRYSGGSSAVVLFIMLLLQVPCTGAAGLGKQHHGCCMT